MKRDRSTVLAFITVLALPRAVMVASNVRLITNAEADGQPAASTASESN